MPGLETGVYNLQPLSEVLDMGPKLLGTVVRQFRWWIIRDEYYQGNQPQLGGKLVKGLTGEETKVITIIDGSEFFPEGLNPLKWRRKIPGMHLDLEHPQNVRLASICNLTERGPLPILPMYALQELDKPSDG